jgi:hypothetical protein
MTTEHSDLADTEEARNGTWMQTSLGGRWFPEDPRCEELFISNIANGLATEYRYGGQSDINHLLTVAEHSYKLWSYVSSLMPFDQIARIDGIYGTIYRRRLLLALAMLLHDASEGMGLKDMARAVKRRLGVSYKEAEAEIQDMVWMRHGLREFAVVNHDLIKELDNRIIANEYPVAMRYKSQPWVARQLQPLPDIRIDCWPPPAAKSWWLGAYETTMRHLGMEINEPLEV